MLLLGLCFCFSVEGNLGNPTWRFAYSLFHQQFARPQSLLSVADVEGEKRV